MSFWDSKTPLAVVAVVAVTVGLSGCGRDVDQVREEALKEASTMVYVKDLGEVTDQLQHAVDPEVIDNVMRLAREENQARAEEYWRCVSPAPSMFPNPFWQSLIGTEDFEIVQLELNADGSASLEQVATAEMVADFEQEPAQLWMLERVGKVTSWSADVDDVVASRTLVNPNKPVTLWGSGECAVEFTMTLGVDGGEEQVPARLWVKPDGRPAELVVNEVPLEQGRP